jgi:hypothetical protein
MGCEAAPQASGMSQEGSDLATGSGNPSRGFD